MHYIRKQKGSTLSEKAIKESEMDEALFRKFRRADWPLHSSTSIFGDLAGLFAGNF